MKFYNVILINNDDAKTVVQEMEQIIETKIEEKSNILSTKADISSLKSELKQDLLKFQVDVEKRFNSLVMWTIGTGIGVVGLIFSVIKLFIVK